MLFSLTPEDLLQMGVEKIGMRIRLHGAIQELRQKRVRVLASDLKVPGNLAALTQICTFEWAQ